MRPSVCLFSNRGMLPRKIVGKADALVQQHYFEEIDGCVRSRRLRQFDRTKDSGYEIILGPVLE